MAVAGGTAPSVRIHLEDRTIVLGHAENRLVLRETRFNPKTGETELKKNGEFRTWRVPTNAVELDLDAAVRRLRSGESFWIRAQDLRPLKEATGFDSIPAVMKWGTK